MKRLRKTLFSLIMLAALLAGSLAVQAKVIVNHDLYNDLNTASQRKAYKAFAAYLTKGAEGKKYKVEQRIYKGKLSSTDLDELRGILSDEYFGIYGECVIDYYARSGGVKEIVANPKRDIGRYKKNVKYSKIIQKKAQNLVKGVKSEKKKSDIIQAWICNHVTYTKGKVDGLSTGDAWCAYKTGKALCTGYAQLYRCMCNAVGINCREVNGYADGINGWEGHEWNKVKINGVWYYADITFLDSGEDDVYTYSSALWSDHRVDSDFYRHK